MPCDSMRGVFFPLFFPWLTNEPILMGEADRPPPTSTSATSITSPSWPSGNMTSSYTCACEKFMKEDFFPPWTRRGRRKTLYHHISVVTCNDLASARNDSLKETFHITTLIQRNGSPGYLDSCSSAETVSKTATSSGTTTCSSNSDSSTV